MDDAFAVGSCEGGAPDGAQTRTATPLLRAGVVVAMGVMASSLAQDNVLARIPLRNLLKNGLHLDRSQSALFLFVAGFAWYAKPLFGVVIDAFPLLGSRRRSYMILGAGLAAAGWCAAALVPQAWFPLLSVLTLTTCATVLVSCATGGMLVETAHATGASGRLAAIRQATNWGCILLAAVLSGYLANFAFGWTMMICALIAASLIPVTLVLGGEPYAPAQPLSALRQQLRALAGAKSLWAAAGLMLMFFIAPGTETALFYRQQNDLHMTTQMQGWLRFAMSAMMILTAGGYHLACRRVPLRTLLLTGIGGTACTGLMFVFYTSIGAAFVIEMANAVAFAIAELAFLDLVVRATPRGSESLGYSLLFGMRSLALFSTDILGAYLLDRHGWSFAGLVLINATTSVLALPIVFLLPAALVNARER